MYPAGVAGIAVRHVRVESDVRLRVLESGPPQGPPVVLLHGWAASAYMHRYAIADLARAGFRAIAVDIKGHGLSDKPTEGDGLYKTAQLLREVQHLIDDLGIDRVALVGQSMGGGLALRLALEQARRVTALALVSPVGLSAIPAARIARVVSPPMLDRFAPHMVPRWLVARLLRLTYGNPERVTERDIDEYWAPSQFDQYARAMRALVREFDWAPLADAELRTLRVPTLLVLGTEDRLIRGVVAAARRLPRARHLVIEGGGHDVNEEHHGRVDAEIVGFLSSVISA